MALNPSSWQKIHTESNGRNSYYADPATGDVYQRNERGTYTPYKNDAALNQSARAVYNNAQIPNEQAILEKLGIASNYASKQPVQQVVTQSPRPSGFGSYSSNIPMSALAGIGGDKNVAAISQTGMPSYGAAQQSTQAQQAQPIASIANAQAPAWMSDKGGAAAAPAPAAKAYGGEVSGMAFGGSLYKPHIGGLLHGNDGGRTDTLNKAVPSGAYVIPADVVSGLGEGNTSAGAKTLDAMFNSAPYGVKMPKAGKGKLHPKKLKDGGMVPVVVAGGEYVIHPEAIVKKFGDLDKGHKTLDAFVKHVRSKTVKTLKKLPPPRK